MKKWYQRDPEGIIENEKGKIMWDFTIQLIIIEKNSRRRWIIDIACPGNKEKIGRLGVKQAWTLKKVKMVAIGFGALGTVSKGLERYIQKIGVIIRLEDSIAWNTELGHFEGCLLCKGQCYLCYLSSLAVNS